MIVADSSGRRPRDAQRTRARILTVARRLFADRGYDATTVRAVASEAGFAPNLITRYFGGKPGLYREASDVSLELPAILPGRFDELGSRIAAGVVRRWQDAAGDDPLLMTLRAAGSSEQAATATGEFFAAQAIRPLAEHLSAELGITLTAAADRAASVTSLIAGVVMARYVLRTGPLAAAGTDALRAWLADNLQRLLDAPPPSLGRPGAGERGPTRRAAQ